MPKFLLLVNHDGGVFEQPMDEWAPDDITAHFNYYEALTEELVASGEMVQFTGLADPRLARIVRSDGAATPMVTDGPFPESKEVLAGFNVIDVASEARALEIAARISAVPGPGGVPTQQPVEVRQVMNDTAFDL
ncbi:YciI family protein [Streptomyces sp. NPDC005813]|uniref:YciI family protein n=1 Tax=Streptomyces sp. NPDC005813 TaxID=3155592 RepID=UPI00340C2C7A